MKRVFLSLLTLAVACTNQATPTVSYPAVDQDAYNFIIASDLGRNGFYEQKPIAALMGDMAENIDIEFVAAAGDVHHFEGVASVNDPLWMTNYELIYDHPELMIEWLAVAGNHEYRGNTQAILDYSKVSRRWVAQSKYYFKDVEISDSISCRIVFVDTTPMMDKYRQDSITYPDASKSILDVQLNWIDSVLTTSNDKYKIVIGHHPIFAQTPKTESERGDMQSRLAPILEKNGVDVYFCGHIHNFQHVKPEGFKTDYVVNSSASLSRKVTEMDGTQFCSPEAGFTLCSMTDNSLKFHFINGKGSTIYSYEVK